jgi:hypothetical protein
MALRTLKPVAAPAETPTPTQPNAAPRLSPSALREIAARADPTQPPAVMPMQEGSELLTLRVRISLSDAIRDQAEAEGITAKMVITRALAAAGLPVSQVDLEDRTPRRRRGRR